MRKKRRQVCDARNVIPIKYKQYTNMTLIIMQGILCVYTHIYIHVHTWSLIPITILWGRDQCYSTNVCSLGLTYCSILTSHDRQRVWIEVFYFSNMCN